MIELRWVKRWNSERTNFSKTLQYRQMQDTNTYAGFPPDTGKNLQMSDWQDVKEVWREAHEVWQGEPS